MTVNSTLDPAKVRQLTIAGTTWDDQTSHL